MKNIPFEKDDIDETPKELNNSFIDIGKNIIYSPNNFIGIEHIMPKTQTFLTSFGNDYYSEVTTLRKQLSDSVNEYKKAQEDKKDTEDLYNKIKEAQDKLKKKEKINHVLSRINEKGQEKALNNSDFIDQFNNGKTCDAVVVSIDIRRSTELMLKARTPQLFSEFITNLRSQLSDCILSNYGVFDKFTGDGILAFFPKFYSGEEAIIRAIKASEECHKVFDNFYNSSRQCFSVFIKDVGLGIGIDYGEVTLINTVNELTVVGIPVVYACRLSSADAGTTILNQPAKEEIESLKKSQTKFIESSIHIKNEGNALVYKVEINTSVFDQLKDPEWTIPVKKQKNKTKN